MTQRKLMRDGIVLTMDRRSTFRRTSFWVDGRVVKAAGQLVDVDVHALGDELAESADGLLGRSGARSIPLSSCRAS